MKSFVSIMNFIIILRDYCKSLSDCIKTCCSPAAGGGERQKCGLQIRKIGMEKIL